jgi:hypothetical protein
MPCSISGIWCTDGQRQDHDHYLRSPPKAPRRIAYALPFTINIVHIVAVGPFPILLSGRPATMQDQHHYPWSCPEAPQPICYAKAFTRIANGKYSICQRQWDDELCKMCAGCLAAASVVTELQYRSQRRIQPPTSIAHLHGVSVTVSYQPSCFRGFWCIT